MKQVDADIDAPLEACSPGNKVCNGRVLETCDAGGSGFDPMMSVTCALGCDAGACVVASNLPISAQQSCTNGAALAPPPGATVILDAGQLTCSDCGGGQTSIAALTSTAGPWFCFSSVNIPASVTVSVGTLTTPVRWFAHGNIVLDGTIEISGRDATGSFTNSGSGTPGAGGPGGFVGGAISTTNDDPGNAGGGPCGGGGGAIVGTGSNAAGGGGGGGGHRAVGGAGGAGRTADGNAVAGGTEGAGTCDQAEGRPLAGGSGGGGGGDGGCGPGIKCGWPGGGGGGAIQISSTTSIAGAGSIMARGGAGFGETTQPGGGGGGGGGGTILLEAPSIMFTGALDVDGGAGGTSKSGAGGAGATGSTVTGTIGSSADANDEGGGGGGGAGGRVRLNARTTPSCANASPAASCSTGALRTTP